MKNKWELFLMNNRHDNKKQLQKQSFSKNTGIFLKAGRVKVTKKPLAAKIR